MLHVLSSQALDASLWWSPSEIFFCAVVQDPQEQVVQDLLKVFN